MQKRLHRNHNRHSQRRRSRLSLGSLRASLHRTRSRRGKAQFRGKVNQVRKEWAQRALDRKDPAVRDRRRKAKRAASPARVRVARDGRVARSRAPVRSRGANPVPPAAARADKATPADSSKVQANRPVRATTAREAAVNNPAVSTVLPVKAIAEADPRKAALPVLRNRQGLMTRSR
jgi:hypothetical protein